MALRRNYNVVLAVAACKCFPWLALSQEQEPTHGETCSRYISSGSALKITAKSFPEGWGGPDMKGCDTAPFPSWDALNPG